MEPLRLKECALCRKNSELELSHIIPKFVIRYLKESSIGQLRSSENPNSTVQDGEKYYMLCGECEDRFSECEKKFADTIFHSYFKQHQRSFEYDKWLYYFITSVSWRHLYLDLIDFVQHHTVGLDALECLIESEQLMREYLLGEREEIGNIEHHIFFFEDISSISDEFRKMQPHVSIHRSIAGYSGANEDVKTYFTMTNMMGIFLFTLYHKGKDEVWENTQIFNRVGKIEAKDQRVTSICGQEIIEIIKRAERDQEQISERQQEKIMERLRKAASNISQYPIRDDWEKDRKL